MARPELLIAAPLRIEAAAIRRGLRGESGATVLRTGMGPAKAKRAASAIVAAGPRAVAVAGFGGGLLDGQRPGDVVLGTGVLSSVLSSVGTTSCRIDGLEISLRALGFRVHRGMLASVNHVVRGTERRRWADRGAIAVDMESATIGEVIAALPFVVLRVLVDTPGRPLAHPGTIAGGLIALRVLGRIGPALTEWANSLDMNSLDMNSPDTSLVKNRETRNYSKH